MFLKQGVHGPSSCSGNRPLCPTRLGITIIQAVRWVGLGSQLWEALVSTPPSPSCSSSPSLPRQLPLNSRLGDHPLSQTLTRVGGTSQLLGRGLASACEREPSGLQGPRPALERGTGRRSTTPAAGLETCPALVVKARSPVLTTGTQGFTEQSAG